MQVPRQAAGTCRPHRSPRLASCFRHPFHLITTHVLLHLVAFGLEREAPHSVRVHPGREQLSQGRTAQERNKTVHMLLFTYINLRLLNKCTVELGDFLTQ